MLEGAAGVVAWAGASLVVLGDGRRGLAAGIALAAAGLGAVAWLTAGPLAAAGIVAGGLVAAVGRWRSGAPGWQMMPAGSTPRIILCVAVAFLCLWIALVVTTGPGSGLRFSASVCMVLAAARILWSERRPVGLSGAAVLALAVGVASASGSSLPDPWPFLAAGLVAAVMAWLPGRWQRDG